MHSDTTETVIHVKASSAEAANATMRAALGLTPREDS